MMLFDHPPKWCPTCGYELKPEEYYRCRHCGANWQVIPPKIMLRMLLALSAIYTQTLQLQWRFHSK